MADNFKGSNAVILQPNDTLVPFSYEWTQCSSTTANDGYLPYNDDIASIAVTAERDDETAATSYLINGTPTVANNIVSMYLDYPTELGEGRYHLTMVATLDSGAVLEADYNRVIAKDL